MAGYRNRPIIILVLLLLISGGVILTQGPNWGIDIEGGSRIMIRVEATEVEVDIEDYTEEIAEEILENIREEFPRTRVLPVHEEAEILRLEIPRRVARQRLRPLIDEKHGLEIEHRVDGSTMDEVIEALRLRVDPYGTLGAQFRSIGDDYIRFEVALDLEEARFLLGETGELEIFVDDNLVIRGDQIETVRPATTGEPGPHVPFTWSEEAAQDWAEATANKTGHRGVIYLDRPADSVILFDDYYLDEFETGLGVYPFDEGEYSEEKEMFRFKMGEWFSVQVPSLHFDGEIDEDLRDRLIEMRDAGRLERIIHLGEELDNDLLVNDNIKIAENISVPIESHLPEDDPIEQLKRIAGLESYPNIQEGVAGEPVEELIITSESMEEARELRTILAQRLPASVEIDSEREMAPRLGEGFEQEALLAGIVALLVVGVVVYIRYRKMKISLPIMLMVFSEVVITLGIASIIPETLMTMGIAEIGGLIAVIGFGVDHQIMITDEVLYGGQSSDAKREPLDRRTRKAYSIIFAAVATTGAAMIALATVGLGAMRGFAIVTIIGALISVGITRPAYARIIGTLLEKE